MAVLFKVKKT